MAEVILCSLAAGLGSAAALGLDPVLTNQPKEPS